MGSNNQRETTMTATARTAHADQLHAGVRDARSHDGHADCDALDPCAGCKSKTGEVRASRKAARVAALTRAATEDAMA